MYLSCYKQIATDADLQSICNSAFFDSLTIFHNFDSINYFGQFANSNGNKMGDWITLQLEKSLGAFSSGIKYDLN